jgi:hypothetical protein
LFVFLDREMFLEFWELSSVIKSIYKVTSEIPLPDVQRMNRDSKKLTSTRFSEQKQWVFLASLLGQTHLTLVSKMIYYCS